MKGKAGWNPLTIAVLVIVLILFGTIAAWIHYKSGESDPSEADARKVFENLRKQLDDGPMEILTFEKVGSEVQEILGVRLFIVEYVADVNYPSKGQTAKVKGRVVFKLADKGWLGTRWLGEDGQFY